MLQLTQKGHAVLKAIEVLSEKDIRLLGFIACEKAAFERSVKAAEYIGYARKEIERLQELGYINS